MIKYQSFTGEFSRRIATRWRRLVVGSSSTLRRARATGSSGRGIELRLLLLTHGHIDHIQDVAKIKRRFGCPVGVHPGSAPMLSDREFFRDFGFQFEIEPVTPDLLIEATLSRDFLGMNFEVLEVPGHCPGSLCFFSRANELLIGGDVLFAGGVGRWDLPGGDGDLLFAGIREKLYPLGDNVTVLPGHGPPTSIGAERSVESFRALSGSDKRR